MTFSPSRKPSLVIRASAASSTEGGGPNSSSSPNEWRKGKLKKILCWWCHLTVDCDMWNNGDRIPSCIIITLVKNVIPVDIMPVLVLQRFQLVCSRRRTMKSTACQEWDMGIHFIFMAQRDESVMITLNLHAGQKQLDYTGGKIWAFCKHGQHANAGLAKNLAWWAGRGWASTEDKAVMSSQPLFLPVHSRITVMIVFRSLIRSYIFHVCSPSVFVSIWGFVLVCGTVVIPLPSLIESIPYWFSMASLWESPPSPSSLSNTLHLCKWIACWVITFFCMLEVCPLFLAIWVGVITQKRVFYITQNTFLIQHKLHYFRVSP